MKKLLPLALLLTACTTSVDESKPQQVLQLPQELSIPYFSSMKLEGSNLELTEVLADNTAYTRYEIRYKSNGLSISGILNIPKGRGPFPLIILNHGYIDPAVYTVGRGLKREQDYLARHGFAVLHTDYRGHGASDLSPDTKEIYDASLEYTMDSLNAINAVRSSTELPTIDATKVGMLGHSLGGGVTLNALVSHPEMINAAVLYAPVSGDAYKNFDRWRRERPEGDNTLATFGEQGSKAWEELSSINYLKNIDDPILLFHGSSDSDVPITWSYELESKLVHNNKNVTFMIFKGEKHEFIHRWNDFMQETVHFFRSSFYPCTAYTSPYNRVPEADALRCADR
ncbi:alpha/beta fold hydrolase [Candidatus Peribacteria bacterium]|nr:alpha/beta fold hydrolase [Candidatus Peribacteria bacterium]